MAYGLTQFSVLSIPVLFVEVQFCKQRICLNVTAEKLSVSVGPARHVTDRITYSAEEFTVLAPNDLQKQH